MNPGRETNRQDRRSVAGILLLLLLSSVLVEGSAAQPATSESTDPTSLILSSTLRVRSEPSGAYVTLRGAHLWKGTTPWDLNRGLSGPYRITAYLDGYERWERTVHLTAGESRQIDIRLTRKSAWKAGMRSLLCPGWGQFYRGRGGKGTIFLLTALGSAAGLVWTDQEYNDRVDDYSQARSAYFASGSTGEFDARRDAMLRAQHRADQAYDRRAIFVYLTGGVYAAAFIDAVFLSSSQADGTFAAVAPWGERGPDLALQGSQEGAIRLAVRWNRPQGAQR